MPEHVAIQPGRLYPQPDYSIQIDKEGKWTVTQVYVCHRNSAVALMPRPGSVHPEVPFVAVSQATTQVTEGDLAEITCTYTGAEAKEEEDEKANAVYTMGLSVTEETMASRRNRSRMVGSLRNSGLSTFTAMGVPILTFAPR